MAADTLCVLFQGKPPARKALFTTSPQRELTFGQLDALVASTARQLQALGVKRGDRVSASLPNGLEFVATFLATTWLGAVAAPLNPNYTTDEVLFYLDDTKPSLHLLPKGDTGKGAAAARAAAEKAGVRLALVACCPAGSLSLEPVGAGGSASTVASGEVRLAEPDDTALILHTSGTTSRPKAVPISHRSIVTSLGNIAATYRLSDRHRAFLVMPLFHVHGLIGVMLSTFHSGGSVVIPPRFSASAFWQDFVRFDCNWYSAVPTIHQMLLETERKKPAGTPAPSRGRLEFIRSCSSALAPATFHQIEQTFGVPVLEAYAMTEAAHQMTSNPLPPAKRKPGSVGIGQGVEVAIMTDDGAALPTGKEGEVCVRGRNVTKGYLNNPAANASSFHKGGWFRTGDQGYIDEEGYIFLTGRLKELINRGGEKIAPLEIDAVLLEHPAVAEAISFGVPDPIYGQEVHAAVVLKAGSWPAPDVLSKQLQEHCRKKLAAFKAPKVFHFATAVPRTATGKIQRRHVAAHFAGPEKPAVRSKL